MRSVKKGLSTFFFILLILALPSATKHAQTTWSPAAQLTTDPACDWNPCGRQILQATEGAVWILWASNKMGNYDIYYNISSDGGATWSNYTQLTTYEDDDDSPSIMQTANGSIWVVWEREILEPEPYQWDLYYKTSNDDGSTWSAEEPLTTDLENDLAPSITQTANGTIWVVWQSDRIWVYDPDVGQDIPQDDIFYKTSSDGGATWSNYTRLTEHSKDDTDPSIIQTSDGKIWVVWVSSRHEYRHLFYRHSSDGGATWSNETQLTTGASHNWAPSITQTTNETIWIVWHSVREGNYDIYYRTSDDGGANWSSDMRLTNDLNVDVTPSVTQTADGKIWIVWASHRTGNYDIWYKTTIHGCSVNADVNRDGDVDFSDFNLFVGSMGCSIGDQGYDPNADLDGDGDVDNDDYVVFIMYYHTERARK